MSSLDDGTVTITLDAEYELRPTLAAAKGISRHFGGYTDALRQLQALDLDAMAAVIRHGTRASDDMQKRLPDLVFAARPLKLVAPLVKYVMILANGGRPVAEEADEGNGAAAKDAA